MKLGLGGGCNGKAKLESIVVFVIKDMLLPPVSFISLDVLHQVVLPHPQPTPDVKCEYEICKVHNELRKRRGQTPLFS